MGKIIALVNQKGGVGKTTTSINLSASLGLLGKKVLLVDLDPQGNATTGVGIEKGDLKCSIHEALNGEVEPKDAIRNTKFKNLDIIPATITLAGTDFEFIERSSNDPSFLKSSQLKRVLNSIRNNYDFVLIDCPPSLGILTVNALTASDSVLIPVQCEYFALEGIMQLLNTIKQARKNLNPTLEIEGVLLTMLSRTNLGLEVVENVRQFFRERVYDTIIPRLIRLTEAPSHGKPIANYDPSSRGTEAYINLAKEVIARNE